MFGKDTDKRFDVIHKEGSLSGFKIIVDKKTGVQYLFSWDGYAGGLTPLLDENGETMIVKKDN
jgi:hypothetical protein